MNVGMPVLGHKQEDISGLCRIPGSECHCSDRVSNVSKGHVYAGD